ncbi:MAG: hypothetical protein R2865_13630 [Deinococcales bacterium]
MTTVLKRLAMWLLLLGLLMPAFARVEFKASSFNSADFRRAERLDEICNAPASASFWCSNRDADTLSPPRVKISSLMSLAKSWHSLLSNSRVKICGGIIALTTTII